MILAVAIAGMIAGCGGSSGHGAVHTGASKHAAAKPACPPIAGTAAVHFLGQGAYFVHASRQPELVNCRYFVAGSFGHLKLAVTLDSSPQAYFRLERTIVEDSQQFASRREYPPPVNVNHLGVAASWFPDENKVMTTDGVTLITVAVHWQGVKAARRRALGVAVARPLLGPLHPPQ